MSYASRLGTVDPAATASTSSTKLVAPVKKQKPQTSKAEKPAAATTSAATPAPAPAVATPAPAPAAAESKTEFKSASSSYTAPMFMGGKALASHLAIPEVKVTHTGTGRCKHVISGDTMILEGKVQKTFTISNITAPRLGNHRIDVPDEPFAYAAREFLRKLCLGKKIAFEADDADHMRFANLYLVNDDGTREDLAAKLVSQGLAKVSLPKDYEAAVQAAAKAKKGDEPVVIPTLSAEKQALLELQQAAKNKKLGMFQTVPAGVDPATFGVRRIDRRPNVRDWFQRFRGVPVTGIVEKVHEGSTIKIEIPSASPSSLHHTVLTVQLCGVSAPRLAMGESGKDEPFAKEASEFVTQRLHGQSVEVTIYGLDRNDNLYATVTLERRNIATRLLEEGLAKFVPWTAALLPPEEQNALFAAASKGAGAGAGIHANGSALVTPVAKEPAYEAVVASIVSPDTYMIRTKNGETKRVSLATIQAAKMREGVMQPFYIEGREFARQLLLGKTVQVQPEYSIAQTESKSGERRDYVNITLNGKNAAVELVSRGLATLAHLSREADRPSCYCDLVIAEGHARDRRLGLAALSPNPERREYKNGDAKSANRIPAAPAPAVQPITVVEFTAPRPPRGQKRDKTAIGAKVRELNEKLGSLISSKISGPVPAVIEHVVSSNAIKLYVPSIQAIFVAHLAGIQAVPKTIEVVDEEATAAAAAAASETQAVPEVEEKESAETKDVVPAPAKPHVKSVGNPIADAALAYVRPLTQLDAVVEFILPGDDKSGRRDKSAAPKRADDRIYVKLVAGTPKQNIAVGLVKNGLATVLPFSAERAGMRAELSQAEQEAKTKKLGVWANYDEAAARAEKARNQVKVKTLSGAGVVEVDGVHYMKIVVTEVYSSTEFYVNAVDDKNFTTVRDYMSGFEPSAQPEGFQVRVGDVVAGQYSADNKWYRVRVEAVRNNGISVRFIDFGNSEKLALDALRPLAREIASIPQLVRACRLTALVPPSVNSEHFGAGQDSLHTMTSGVVFNARIDHVDETDSGLLYHVTVMDTTNPQNTVNNVILSQGLARVNRRSFNPAIRAVAETYAEAEEQARLMHYGLFEYGGADSDEE